MLNETSSTLSFTDEEIDDILKEEMREKTILEELRENYEPYELSLYVSEYDRALFEMPLEVERECGVARRF